MKHFLKAVLNVQSSKLTLLLSQKDGAVLRVAYVKELPYDGFSDGQFFDEKALVSAVTTLVADAEATLKIRIRKLLVGVSGDFTPVVNRQFDTAFSKLKKLTEKDVDYAHKEGDVYTGMTDYTAINVSPIFYLKGAVKLSNPVGILTDSLTSNVSYVLLENYFKNVFDNICAMLKIKVSYCSTVLAEGVYLIPYEVSDNGAILVNSDFTSTSVSYFAGAGIIGSATFELGTAHILNGILDKFNNRIPYAHAEELLKKINLNIINNATQSYTVNDGGEVYHYGLLDVNEVCYEVIQCIASQVKRAIDAISSNVSPSSPIILTGDGIASIVGVKEAIERITERTVIIVTPTHAELQDVKYSALAGLMCYSLYAEKGSILDRICSFLHIGG